MRLKLTTLKKFAGSNETSSNLPLILTLVWVIETSYTPATRSPLIIGKYAETEMSKNLHNDIVEEILHRSSETGIKFLLEADKIHKKHRGFLSLGVDLDNEEYFYRLYGKKDKAIWFIDSMESFSRLEADLLDERFFYTRNGFFCIVYSGVESNRLDHIKLIFQRLFDIYVLNVNLLVTIEKYVYVYTYHPFALDKCHSTEPKLLGVNGPITGYNFSSRIFFTNKLYNMWGCNLTVTTWIEPPYIYFKNKTIHGIEGLLLRTLADRMNFSITFKPVKENMEGDLSSNVNDTGFMKMLKYHKTNITIIGLIYDKRRVELAEAAYTYLNCPLMLVIPKGRTMTPFERLLRPFKFVLWICFSVSLSLAVLIIFIIKRCFKPLLRAFVFGANNRTPFTNLWTAMYGVTIHGHLPRRNFARYLLIIWILYTWVLRSAYIGELYILLQDSRARSDLQTVAEVLKQNYTIFAYPIIAPILFDASKRPHNIRDIDSDQNSIPKLFERLANGDRSIAVTVQEHVLRTYNQQPENVNRTVTVLPETVVTALITFYMPKHSYLKLAVDNLLVQILAAGIIKKFENLYLDEGNLWKKQKQEPQLLSLWLLFGLFSIYIFLMILCFLVFLLEIWTKRSHCVKRIIDFFNY